MKFLPNLLENKVKIQAKNSFDVVSKRNIFFAISAAVLLPGIVALVIFGLPLGIDFTGGTLWELRFEKPPDSTRLTNFFRGNKIEVVSLQSAQNSSYILRSAAIDQSTKDQAFNALSKNFAKVEDTRFETIGPTVSANLAKKAILALSFATVAILLFIAWSFRKVPKPASSLAFGVCAILAVIHDVGVLVGAFAILGRVGATVDSLFVTAALTVIGFSVHDTIVVFDRIRENLSKFSKNLSFSEIVNFSILQTMGRSLATSITIVLVLAALLLFGGASIRWFVAALLIGIISGTYSSIFTAAPLLVVWQNLIKKKV